MAVPHITDPLAVASSVAYLRDGLMRHGLEVIISSDITALRDDKAAARNTPLTPYFDNEVAGLTEDRFFWLKLRSKSLPIAAFQAFRLDHVETSLADWAPAYTIGLYMLRGELLVPDQRLNLSHSIARNLKGRLVYNGELWISSQIKNRHVYELFSKLGLILSLIRWTPDCVWALADHQMATRGHPVRGGFNVHEGGFLRWQWAGTGIPAEEWLHIADTRAIEQIVDGVNFESGGLGVG